MIVMRGAAGHDVRRKAVSAYLRGIARHLVQDRLRTDARFVTLADDQLCWADADVESRPELVEALLRRDEVQRLHAALFRIRPRLREVLMLCDLQGRSYEQAAQDLAVPIGTVRSRLFRARQALAVRLLKETAPMPVWRRAITRYSP